VFAWEEGHTEIAKLLIASGADVNVNVKTLEVKRHREVVVTTTLLNHAWHSRNVEIVKLLIEAGAEIAEVQRVIEEATDPVFYDMFRNGFTELMLAAETGRTDFAKLLIEKGADVNAENDEGHIALGCASYYGHIEIAESLIEAGAEVNAQNIYGVTALMAASFAGYTDIAKLLIDKGANVSVQDELGYTAFLWAVENGQRC
jgi:ankyrin repeat protein